jgi:hypothetical protein
VLSALPGDINEPGKADTSFGPGFPQLGQIEGTGCGIGGKRVGQSGQIILPIFLFCGSSLAHEKAPLPKG